MATASGNAGLGYHDRRQHGDRQAGYFRRQRPGLEGSARAQADHTGQPESEQCPEASE